MSTIDPEIDKLTRERISKEMKVPAMMVNNTSDIYKRIYSEIEKNGVKALQVTDNKDDKKDTKKVPFDKNSWKTGNKSMKRYPHPNDLDDTDDSDEVINFENGDINISTTKSDKKDKDDEKDTFNIRGEDIKKKIRWLDLPTDAQLDEYSKKSEVCKCLVDIYRKRYHQIKDQLDELKAIANDIDRYSNYN